MSRHNHEGSRPTRLTLSEVRSQADRPDDVHQLPHEHISGARLCVPCVVRRHRELNPSRRRGPYAVELIAARIRRDSGRVFGAVNAFGISYRHACRIRNGWRPGGRQAAAIPYDSRGWISGRRVGYVDWTESELRLAWGDR